MEERARAKGRPEETYESLVETPARAPNFNAVPELRDVTAAEMNEVIRRATLYAVKKTKNEELANRIVSRVLEKITTTRRWDPKKTDLVVHVCGCVKSEISHEFKSKVSEHDRVAHEGFHREMRPGTVASPEDLAVEQEEFLERRAKARAVIERLKARFAEHPLMPKVFARMEEEEETPAQMAQALSVPVGAVYRAVEGIKYHLRKIREEDAAESEGR